MNLLSAKPLRIFPNPYHAIDHQGLPAGAARRDPDFQISAGMRLYVAADLAEVRILAQRDRVERSAGLAPTVQEHAWYFVTDRATGIEDTAYHRALIKSGEIFPADEGTHRRAFGRNQKTHPFVEPREAITRSRQQAIETWKAEHEEEEPAFVEVEKAAADELAARAPVEKAPTPPVTSSIEKAAAAEAPTTNRGPDPADDTSTPT